MPYKNINIINLKNNVKHLQEEIGKNTKFCAVVKANAYGHTISKIVPNIDDFVDYYAVNSTKEGITLRKYTKKNILILGKSSVLEIKKTIKYDFEYCIDNEKDLEHFNNMNKPINIQIAINTGMNRLGINPKRVSEFLNIVKKYPLLNVSGIFSHISDTKNPKRTYSQYKYFLTNTSKATNKIIKHIANTDALLFYPSLKLDMVRVGIGLYGYGKNLSPVMSIFARVISIQNIKKNEYIGYGTMHKSRKNTTLAVINIGYADGLPRNYAKYGSVIINDTLCKIVGNICMNMTIVDVGNIECCINTTAIILGKSATHKIDANDIAKCCNTIPYEILTNFSKIELSN